MRRLKFECLGTRIHTTYDPLYTDVYIQGVAGAPEPATRATMLISFAGPGFAFSHSHRKMSLA
jgi:hypothetical protein